jgi:ubiquinone/menaquinone biosynthesis C-methylase UbiE
MDVGYGSGRWAKFVAPQVGRLVFVDASPEVLEVARKSLDGLDICEFHCSSVAALPDEDHSMDLVYSLSVLHHVPDTPAAL